LWIIVYFFISKYRYDFIYLKRLFLTVHKIYSNSFIPYPIILILFYITHSKAELNGSLPNNTIAPFGFMILLSSFHIRSKGIILSHLQAVVPVWRISNDTIYTINQEYVSFTPNSLH
jgi:hypothetical protein